jgi:hypothetical protein
VLPQGIYRSGSLWLGLGLVVVLLAGWYRSVRIAEVITFGVKTPEQEIQIIHESGSIELSWSNTVRREAGVRYRAVANTYERRFPLPIRIDRSILSGGSYSWSIQIAHWLLISVFLRISARFADVKEG